jgi:HEAT repeat protein
MALGLLPQFRGLASEESEKVFQLVVQRLDDPEPDVRMAASRALVNLGNRAAIPYLEAAIAGARDKVVRSVFEANLKKVREESKQ